MQIQLGEHIRSQDGQDIGVLKYLVLGPVSGKVKTLVVEKGFLLPDDVEIPIDALQESGGNGIYVNYTAEQVKQLPRFDVLRYSPAPPDQTLTMMHYPLGGVLWPNGYPLPVPVVDGEIAASPPEVEDYLRREAENNAVISAGDDVFSRDGERVGEVHRVTFDTATGQPTRIVVRRGHLFHKDTELPAETIASIEDGVVNLNLDRAQLETRRNEENFAVEWSESHKPSTKP